MNSHNNLSRLFLGEQLSNFQGFERLIIGFNPNLRFEDDDLSRLGFTLNSQFQEFDIPHSHGITFEFNTSGHTREKTAEMKGKQIIKEMKFQKSNGGDCSICHSKIRKNSRIPKLSCHHEFHQKCLFNWVKIRGNCPMCRADIKTKKDQL